MIIQNFKGGLRRNIFYFAFSFSILIFAFCIFPVARAQDQITVNGSGAQIPAANPGAVVGQVYQFALLIGGLLAFGAIVYGGIKYTVSAGNPSVQSDAREWITGALQGLLLLLGSYLILKTINPNLVNLNLPTLEKLKPPPAAPAAPVVGAGGVRLTDAEARKQLEVWKIDTKVSNTSLAYIRQETITEIVKLKQSCILTCDIKVTGGTEQTGGHEEGLLSHANGYKIDLGLTANLTDYITKNFIKIEDRGEKNGTLTPQWRSPTGAIYAKESNHWDVLVP